MLCDHSQPIRGERWDWRKSLARIREFEIFHKLNTGSGQLLAFKLCFSLGPLLTGSWKLINEAFKKLKILKLSNENSCATYRVWKVWLTWWLLFLEGVTIEQRKTLGKMSKDRPFFCHFLRLPFKTSICLDKQFQYKVAIQQSNESDFKLCALL